MGWQVNSLFVRNHAHVIALIYTVIMVFAVIAVWIFIGRFTSRGHRAVGTITSIEEIHTDDGFQYQATIAYTTHDGRTISAPEGGASNPALGRINDRIQLSYLDDNPEKFIILSYWRTFVFLYILIGMAAAGMLYLAGHYWFQKNFGAPPVN